MRILGFIVLILAVVIALVQPHFIDIPSAVIVLGLTLTSLPRQLWRRYWGWLQGGLFEYCRPGHHPSGNRRLRTRHNPVALPNRKRLKKAISGSLEGLQCVCRRRA
ncbi:MAG: hypothetical protein HOC74_06655 [Gemmatimonadetes bacterium]|nr:hypothetical protein [Gemmatimonadota bacterium]